MDKKLILTIDDETHILELLKYNLETAGYDVIQAESGEQGLELLEKHNVSAMLLDLMLPGIDGLEVLRRVRQNARLSRTPVIMLTAKSEEFDKVLGLEMGADDYIPKPFGIRELLARLKAVLRRADNPPIQNADEKIISRGILTINAGAKTVSVGDKIVELSLKEFELLRFLAENPGRVFSRDLLLERIWGYEYIGETRTVDVHIRHIRKKIEADDANPVFIKTLRGFGYKFSEDIK